MNYRFWICLTGEGETCHDAWLDALVGINLAPTQVNILSADKTDADGTVWEGPVYFDGLELKEKG